MDLFLRSTTCLHILFMWMSFVIPDWHLRPSMDWVYSFRKTRSYRQYIMLIMPAKSRGITDAVPFCSSILSIIKIATSDVNATVICLEIRNISNIKHFNVNETKLHLHKNTKVATFICKWKSEVATFRWLEIDKGSTIVSITDLVEKVLTVRSHKPHR